MRGVGLKDRITLWSFDSRGNLRMRYYNRVPYGMSISQIYALVRKRRNEFPNSPLIIAETDNPNAKFEPRMVPLKAADPRQTE